MVDRRALGAGVAVAATVGDLTESTSSVTSASRTWGTLLPGHGGVMDRLDSLVLVAPMAWAVLALLVAVILRPCPAPQGARVPDAAPQRGRRDDRYPRNLRDWGHHDHGPSRAHQRAPPAGPADLQRPRRGKPPRHLADLSPAERKEAVEALGHKGFRAKQLSTHYFERLVAVPER